MLSEKLLELTNHSNVDPARIGAKKIIDPQSPPVSSPHKRFISIFQEGGDNWADSFVASIEIKDAPGAPSSVALYIIIGVITAVALIITVVLIMSLSKKRDDDYMPVDDLEDDRLLADTY